MYNVISVWALRVEMTGPLPALQTNQPDNRHCSEQDGFSCMQWVLFSSLWPSIACSHMEAVGSAAVLDIIDQVLVARAHTSHSRPAKSANHPTAKRSTRGVLHNTCPAATTPRHVTATTAATTAANEACRASNVTPSSTRLAHILYLIAERLSQQLPNVGPPP